MEIEKATMEDVRRENGILNIRAVKWIINIPTEKVDLLYYIAFTSVLFYQYIFMTRFEREPFQVFYIFGAAVACVAAGLRWVKYLKTDKVYCLVSVGILAIGAAYFLVRGSYYFLVLALLVVGAKDVKTEQLLQIYIAVAVCMIAVILNSYFGEGGILELGVKHHFGSINSTDFQGLLFFVLLPYLVLRRERITYFELAFSVCVVVFFWRYTLAENNLYCSLIAIAVGAYYKTYKSMKKNTDISEVRKESALKSLLMSLMVLSFVLFGIVMIFLVAKYDQESEAWVHLNLILHKRLEYAHKVFLEYPPSFFGSEFDVVGWGFTPGVSVSEQYALYGYTYIDSSYPNILIMHGEIIFIALIGGLTYLSYRYKKSGNYYMVFLLAVLALDCCAEGHLKELECNPFLALPFARLLSSSCTMRNNVGM